MEFEHHEHIREEMTEFWKGHSHEATVLEMMLDFEADDLSPKEIPEVLALLPDVKGKRVLELGAGIGRYTGEIAKKAKSVVAVDFMEIFIKKNEEDNSHFGNIDFIQADVTQLVLKANSFDVVFSNWLFMYLDDDESFKLMQNIMNWLSPDGYLFLRESCYHPCGTKNADRNPTMYRTSAQYNHMIYNVTQKDQVTYIFKELFVRSIQTYVKVRNNRNQLCWLVQKVQGTDNVLQGYHNFQEFLDEEQYSKKNILMYEKVYGKDFISPGGKQSTEEFVKMLDLQPGQSVIDVGCGIGGCVFYIAQNYDVQLLGIDLSQNMIDIAMKRATELKNDKIDFEVADCTERQYPDGKYNVVYSRDSFLHIKDKKAVFGKFWKWLSPGGKILITDYCCKEGNWSKDFSKYVDKRGYHLLSPTNYGRVLESAGFVNVKAEDKTDKFSEILKNELTKTESMREEFIKEFSQEDYNNITSSWKDKLLRCNSGEQKWGLFYAEKPKH